jgi:protein-tyrosine phosphatase
MVDWRLPDNENYLLRDHAGYVVHGVSWMNTQLETAPLDAFWVRQHQLMAGEYPGDRQSDRAKQKVRWLAEAGITVFIDLTEDAELLPYNHYLASIAVSKQAIEHVRMPIRDVNVPTEADMVRILDLIDAKLKDGHVVYVHCWGGVGRTGTVVGCFLVRHGMSGHQALVEIRRIRRNSRKAWRVAPETGEQRAMVVRWTCGK